VKSLLLLCSSHISNLHEASLFFPGNMNTSRKSSHIILHTKHNNFRRFDRNHILFLEDETIFTCNSTDTGCLAPSHSFSKFVKFSNTSVTSVSRSWTEIWKMNKNYANFYSRWRILRLWMKKKASRHGG
jgi:hypothetical protein